MSRQRTNSGLTFLEVMIVIVIIGVMFAIVLPTFKGTRENQAVAAAARQIASSGMLARQYAIAYQAEVKLAFRPTEKEWQLIMPEPEDSRARRDLRRDEPNSSEENPNKLPQRVTMKELRLDDEILDEEEEFLTFFPNGSCSGMAIHVEAANGRALTVDFDRATGRPEVYQGEPKSFAQKLKDRGLNPADFGLEDDGTAVASTRAPGEGFYQSAGMSSEDRIQYYEDAADRIMRRTRAQYEAQQAGGPGAYYREAQKWGQ